MRQMFETIRVKLYRLLRWSEQYTRTDMIYLVGGGFWVVLSQVIASALALALSVAFARLLSSTDFGLYKYVLSLAGMVTIVSLTGMATAVTQAVSSGSDGSLRVGFVESMRWSAGMVVILLGMGIYYFAHGNSFLGLSLCIAALLQPLSNSAGLFANFLVAKKLFKENTLYRAASATFTTVALIVTAYFYPSPIAIVIAYFVTTAIGSGASYLYALTRYKPKGGAASGMVRYAQHLSLINVVGGIAGHIDKIVVFQFVGVAELAIYAFAIALPEQVWGVTKGLGNLMLPKFAAYPDNKSIKQTLLWKMVLLGTSLLAVTVVYILAAPLLFSFLFPTYMAAVPYSQLFALSLVFLVSIVPINVLTARKMERSLYTLNVSTSVLQIALIIPMAMLYGLWGVIITRIIVRFAQVTIATVVVMVNKD